MEGNGPNAGSTQFVEGFRLAITTTLGEEFEGEVLNFDKFSNNVILQDIGSSGMKKNLRFLKINFIKDIRLLGRADEPFEFHIPHIDLNQLRMKEEAALRQAETDAERIGVGVTQEAQDIFDALSKTLPVRWDKSTIVVMDEVRVSSPHTPENVAGGSPAAMERVRKVLELERRRLQERL